MRYKIARGTRKDDGDTEGSLGFVSLTNLTNMLSSHSTDDDASENGTTPVPSK